MLSRADVRFAKGDHSECEPILGVYGRSPQQGPVVSGGEGAKFPEAESIWSVFVQKRAKS